MLLLGLMSRSLWDSLHFSEEILSPKASYIVFTASLRLGFEECLFYRVGKLVEGTTTTSQASLSESSAPLFIAKLEELLCLESSPLDELGPPLYRLDFS